MVALLVFDPKPFTGGDNYWYMTLAEGLRSGEGYRDLWLPDQPPHTRYPPVYPLLLAAIGFVADSVLAFKLTSLALTTAVVALTTAWATHRSGNAVALPAGLIVGLMPAVVEYSHWVLSEPAFTFFVALALYGLARDDASSSGRWFGLAVAASVLAALTRSAGLPLLAAVAVSVVVRRRWPRLGFLVGATVIALGAWWLRNRWVSSADIPYSEWLLFRDPYNPSLGTVTMGELVARVAHNVAKYTTAVWPRSVAGRDLGPGLAGAVGIVTALVAAVGAGRRLPRLEAPEIFFFGYLAVIFLWPEAWTDQRLLLPLLPMAGVYLIEAVFWAWGAGSTAEGARRGTVRPALVTAGLCVALAGFGTLRGVPAQLRCTTRYVQDDPYACYPPAFADFLNVAAWTRENTEAQAVVINRKPQIFYWVSRRRGDVYPFTTDPDSLIRFLEHRRADYVVVDQLSATTYLYLLPAVRLHRDRFRVAHHRGDPPTYLLRFFPTEVE